MNNKKTKENKIMKQKYTLTEGFLSEIVNNTLKFVCEAFNMEGRAVTEDPKAKIEALKNLVAGKPYFEGDLPFSGTISTKGYMKKVIEPLRAELSPEEFAAIEPLIQQSMDDNIQIKGGYANVGLAGLCRFWQKHHLGGGAETQEDADMHKLKMCILHKPYDEKNQMFKRYLTVDEYKQLLADTVGLDDVNARRSLQFRSSNGGFGLVNKVGKILNWDIEKYWRAVHKEFPIKRGHDKRTMRQIAIDRGEIQDIGLQKDGSMVQPEKTEKRSEAAQRRLMKHKLEVARSWGWQPYDEWANKLSDDENHWSPEIKAIDAEYHRTHGTTDYRTQPLWTQEDYRKRLSLYTDKLKNLVPDTPEYKKMVKMIQQTKEKIGASTVKDVVKQYKEEVAKYKQELEAARTSGMSPEEIKAKFAPWKQKIAQLKQEVINLGAASAKKPATSEQPVQQPTMPTASGRPTDDAFGMFD